MAGAKATGINSYTSKVTSEFLIKDQIAKGYKTFSVKDEKGKEGKIIIRIPYKQDLIQKIKSIPGRRWNPKRKYWEVPYSEEIIPKLQSLFGEGLVVDPYFYLFPLQKELLIRRYSRRTIKSYMRYNREFLLFAGKKSEEIENEDIKRYLYYMVKRRFDGCWGV